MRVVVFGPPLNNSGGVGTLFTYFKNEVGDQVDLKFIDTRGPSRFAAMSVLNLSLAIIEATKLKLQKKIDIAHVNMGSRGSAFRKLTLTFWLKRVLHIPTALHLHASSFDTWMDGTNPTTRKLVISGINSSDRLFVLGEVWKLKLVHLGVNEALIEVLVMGVSELTGKSLGVPSNSKPIKILFAGEMSERKGLPNLLDAMSDPGLSDFCLSVAGTGSVEKWHEYLVAKPASERVKLLGHISLKEVHYALIEADILILPSRAEGLPVSVMEAFSSRTAVVCTSVGALNEYLVDEVNSTVLRSTAAEDIVKSLLTMQSSDRRVSLAEAGHIVWAKHFDAKVCSQLLIDHWLSILASKTI